MSFFQYIQVVDRFWCFAWSCLLFNSTRTRCVWGVVSRILGTPSKLEFKADDTIKLKRITQTKSHVNLPALQNKQLVLLCFILKEILTDEPRKRTASTLASWTFNATVKTIISMLLAYVSI